MSSEPRFALPYSLAEHIYAGHGLGSIDPAAVDELAAMLIGAERKAAAPLIPGNVDELIAACLELHSDPFTQWEHELVTDEVLREMVAPLLPAGLLETHEAMADRLRRSQGW